MNIYVPTELIDSDCFVINDNFIRAYTNSDLTEYTDIFINQDYMTKTGISEVYTGSCDISDNFTDNFYYRVDFYKILIMFLIMSIFIIYIPIKIFSKLFKRGSL